MSRLAQIRMPPIVRPEHRYGYNRTVYKSDGHGDTGNEADPYHAQNADLAKRMWEAIQAKYPGQPLTTGANYAQGVCMIYFNLFTPQPYIIKIANLKADPGLKRVVRAAGEILERYRIPRSGFTVSDMVNALTKWRPTHRLADRPPE